MKKFSFACFSVFLLLVYNYPSEAASSAGCSGGSGSEGSSVAHEITVSGGGGDRDYVTTTPDVYDGTTPVPVVFVMHPLTGTAAYMMNAWGGQSTANTYDTMLVSPQGLSNAWSTSSSSSYDVVFLNALMDEIEADYCVDTDKAYFAGFSMGGFMSHIMGNVESDRVAAVFTVASAIPSGYPAGSPKHPKYTMMVHADNDEVLPWGDSSSPGVHERDRILYDNSNASPADSTSGWCSSWYGSGETFTKHCLLTDVSETGSPHGNTFYYSLNGGFDTVSQAMGFLLYWSM